MEKLTNERFAEIIRDKEICEFCEYCGNDDICINCKKVKPATVKELRLFWKELSALVEARDEGRVVVPDTSCKPLVWGDDDYDTALCPDCGKDLMGLYDGERIVLQCPACGQYLDDTKIITRAEAEAALGGGGDG